MNFPRGVSMRWSARHPGPGLIQQADVWLAGSATLVLGLSAVVVVAGAAVPSTTVAIAAGAAGIALVTLVAAGWLNGLIMLVMCLPLPALVDTAQLRVGPAAIATIVVSAGWLFGRCVDPRPIDLKTLPRGAIISWIGAVVLATAFAQSVVPAVRELVNLSLFLILLVAATDLLAVHPRRIRALVISLAVVGGLCGILAVMEAAGIWRGQFPLAGTSLNRATLGFGWPNELAMFLAMILPLTVHTFQAARGAASRSLAFAAIAATAMGLAATFSRGSWLAVVTSALVLLLVRRSPSMFRAWALALAGVLVINFLFGGAVQNRIMQTMADPYVVQRAALTWAGLLMFQAHPIVGVGPGGFGANLDRFGPQIDMLWDYVGSAHNAYVEVAAEMGMIGLAAFVFLLIAIFTRLLRGARRAELDPTASDQERSLRRALLWSFATFCTVAWTAWPLAHGLGQLVMLVAAAGFALDIANSRRADAVR